MTPQMSVTGHPIYDIGHSRQTSLSYIIDNMIISQFGTMLGKAIGITASILIFIYIQDQVTYDKHNENYERIYRLEGDFFIIEKLDQIAIVHIPLAPTLKDEYPEV